MQGKCYYCGKELTERTIKRHMKNCSEMKKIIEDKIQNPKEVRDQFLISIKYKKNSGKYCIYMSIDANLQLEHIDKFIRDIWVECCGHSSTFYIDKQEYSSNSDGQLKMNIHLKDILNVNQKFEYKYDFDLTKTIDLFDKTFYGESDLMDEEKSAVIKSYIEFDEVVKIKDKEEKAMKKLLKKRNKFLDKEI